MCSVWNQENRFTGWCDIPLTDAGEADASDAGQLLRDRELKFDVAFTSNLERAWRTCALILSASGELTLPYLHYINTSYVTFKNCAQVNPTLR